MRVVIELIGIFMVLLGSYLGGKQIFDRWNRGTEKEKKK